MAKEKADLFREVYESGGMRAVLDRIGVTPQAAYREIDEILSTVSPLPPAEQVFAAFDATRKPGEKGDVAPVLALMGLKVSDLTPGESPWACRVVDERGKKVERLIVSLRDGRKVRWERPA